MKKPLIGIVSKPALVTDMWHFMEIVDDIRLVLMKNNALAVGILPTDRKIIFKEDEEIDNYKLTIEERKDLEDEISRLDGVILEGGLVSNKYEEEVARICIEKDIPLLGMCSGFNNMVRALGGNVSIDKSLFHNQFGKKIAHEITIDENSRLYKIVREKTIVVNSIHTCITKEEDIKGYKVVAKCLIDDTVEAIELENKRFILGVKFHPELMESMNPIFEKFVKECSKSK